MGIGKLIKTGSYKKGYVPVADGLRVIALSLIWIFHIWQQNWLNPVVTIGSLTLDFTAVVHVGYMMVDVLLLLSGFLLFLPYARTMVYKEPMPDTAGFYKKRAARILPSYYLALLIMLFTLVLPRFTNMREFWVDVVSHLTFTHDLSFEANIETKFNNVLWTLAVEVQFYLIAPFLCRAFVKKPVITYMLMTASALFFRLVYVAGMSDTRLYFNALPAFTDVYANGMGAAFIMTLVQKKLDSLAVAKENPNENPDEEPAKTKPTFYKNPVFTACVALIVCVLSILGIKLIIDSQALVGSEYEVIRYGQMVRRFPLSFFAALFLVSGSFAPRAFQWLFNNKVMTFFAGISFNFYMWHHQIAVWLKQWRIPPYVTDMPELNGERPWVALYTLACFLVTAVLASLLTYLWEKPMQRLLLKLLNKPPKEE